MLRTRNCPAPRLAAAFSNLAVRYGAASLSGTLRAANGLAAGAGDARNWSNLAMSIWRSAAMLLRLRAAIGQLSCSRI